MDGENNGKPIKMDDLGVPLFFKSFFGNTHINTEKHRFFHNGKKGGPVFPQPVP